MKHTKKLPYIFIAVLVFILTFTIGVQHGKNVEEKNKVIKYVLSITPTRPPTPTVEAKLVFQTFKHEGCGIQFLYPSTLKEAANSSDSASLNQQTNPGITFRCDKQNTDGEKKPVASASVELKSKKIFVEVKKGASHDYFIFQTKHPTKNTYLHFTIDKDIYPLFEKSLEFSAK
jgi:hypothetical protein